MGENKGKNGEIFKFRSGKITLAASRKAGQFKAGKSYKQSVKESKAPHSLSTPGSRFPYRFPLTFKHLTAICHTNEKSIWFMTQSFKSHRIT
jgi:hypothetical protein